MFNPVYLAQSRNGVFYFRWPLPKQLHPLGKPSTLKLSLRTREPRKALRLSRLLSQIGERLNEYGLNSSMRYDELRAQLTDHFRGLLHQAKEQIDATGPLTDMDRATYETSLLVAQQAKETDTPLSLLKSDDDLLARFIEKYDLQIKPGSREYRWLQGELKTSYESFLKAVLAYNGSLRVYDLEIAENGSRAPTKPTEQPSGMTLAEVAEAYTTERKIGKTWSVRTGMEKEAHFKLLAEVLGADIQIRSLTAADAKRVKDILLAYPKNRDKNPQTRGKALDEIVGLAGTPTIQVTTINKYLQNYGDLFQWAKQNNHIDVNYFAGLSVKEGKRLKSAKRDAFKVDQIQLILRTVLQNERGLITKSYQKWATLIGIYTGARLGEIAQLHLTDIRQQDGIWCFDINDEGATKNLKAPASRRLVPIHRELIQAGLLDYVQSMKDRNVERLFPDFSYSSKNGWGRQQSRWFNERLLVKLGIKSKTLVFHSLRHTVNTRLLQAGIPDPIVKAVIGHEQEGMTQKQYFKEGYTLQQLEEAMQMLCFRE